MRAIFIAALMVGLAGSFHARVFGESSLDYDRCRDEDQDAGARIFACSQIINDINMPEDVRAEAYVHRGEAYGDKPDYDAAIADHTQALRLRPNYADAYNLRAWAYFKAGKAQEGLADAEKAVALQPQSANALDTRAHIYEVLGKKEQAIADYRKALSLDPQLDESKEGLARLGARP